MGPDTGLVVLSVYMYHTKLASLLNTALIRRAISVARENGSPWILAGDFNMTPEQLQANWGNLLELAGATIVATSEPPHVPSKGESRTIDFAICSSSAYPWDRKIAIDLGVEASPHRAVRITVNAHPKNHLIQEHATPKSIPRV